MGNFVVTGGASFIGSHLVEKLLIEGFEVTVIDDFSSGRKENLSRIEKQIRVVDAKIQSPENLVHILEGCNVVVHLAAIHGGRGFIETYPNRVMENFAIDYAVFEAARRAGVERVVQASSACAYPIDLQESYTDLGYLEEKQAHFISASGSFPDGAYGWVKLMGEFQLQTLAQSSNVIGRSARIFTAYGSRENESHAAVALLAKALLKVDPYPIWGNGQQTRNFTHVTDTAKGLFHLATDSRPENYLAVNVGSSQHLRVLDLVEVIFDLTGWRPKEIEFQMDRPTGVKSRAANNDLMKSISGGWEPITSLQEGMLETFQWYRTHVFPKMDPSELENRLLSR